jgi:hypothetical protein
MTRLRTVKIGGKGCTFKKVLRYLGRYTHRIAISLYPSHRHLQSPAPGV